MQVKLSEALWNIFTALDICWNSITKPKKKDFFFFFCRRVMSHLYFFTAPVDSSCSRRRPCRPTWAQMAPASVALSARSSLTKSSTLTRECFASHAQPRRPVTTMASLICAITRGKWLPWQPGSTVWRLQRWRTMSQPTNLVSQEIWWIDGTFMQKIQIFRLEMYSFKIIILKVFKITFICEYHSLYWCFQGHN